ncbi:MAG: TetR/AcrR family transcriptional regulator [Cellulomonadaceae bacterium]
MTDHTVAVVGRRERNALERRARIAMAAAELFAERGFAAVTTHEIAERADVADGTLFRYATSKGELLLMVYNEEFRAALAAGEERARSAPALVDAIEALVAPTLSMAHAHPENALVYMRELIFGNPAEKFRARGIELVMALQADIGQRLLDAARASGTEPEPDAARLAAISIFGALELTLARWSTGAHPGHDAARDLRGQITQITTGFLAGATAPPP